MDSSITRIADLPAPNSNDKKNTIEQPNNYVPINVHPNPYGI